MTDVPEIHRFTRRQLYELVWSAPVRTLAPRYGISDVAFAKTCRGHDIPLPPRGYWAKKQAGKKVSQMELPPRGIGVPEMIEFGGYRGWGYSVAGPDLIHREIPAPPEFPEPISRIKQTVAASVGKVIIPRSFERAHRQIVDLLAADDARHRARLASKHPYLEDEPRFQSPFERRRFRLLNAIFIAVEKAGHRAYLQGKDPSDFHVGVGAQQVRFTLDAPGRQRDGSRPTSPADRPASDPLRLVIASIKEYDDVASAWQDHGADLLEQHVTEIVVALIVAGEVQYRQGELHRVEWLMQRKAEFVERERKRREEEERRAREARIRAEKARIDRLLGEAAALRQARDIRAYVEEVRAQNAAAREPLPADKVEAWATWANAQADRIDPVLTGRFLDYGSGDEPTVVEPREPHWSLAED